MNVKNVLMASAVAGLFLSAPAMAKGKTQSKTSSVVKCAGVNSCKGQGSCAGADNSCKSHNECKGKGWVETASAKECAAKGGKVLAMKM